jgi:hypothetical protein
MDTKSLPENKPEIQRLLVEYKKVDGAVAAFKQGF